MSCLPEQVFMEHTILSAGPQNRSSSYILAKQRKDFTKEEMLISLGDFSRKIQLRSQIRHTVMGMKCYSIIGTHTLPRESFTYTWNRCWFMWVKKWNANFFPPSAQMQITLSLQTAWFVNWNVSIIICSVSTDVLHCDYFSEAALTKMCGTGCHFI